MLGYGRPSRLECPTFNRVAEIKVGGQAAQPVSPKINVRSYLLGQQRIFAQRGYFCTLFEAATVQNKPHHIEK